MDLTEQERKVLGKLWSAGEEYCYGFAPIAADTKLDRKQVREACRSLRDKGLTRFERALWDEYDGTPAGSGYGLTREGRTVAQERGIFLCEDCGKVFVEGPTSCADCTALFEQMKRRVATAPQGA